MKSYTIYYFKIKDIYETLSPQCLDVIQLENVINDHFQNYKVTMDVEKENLKNTSTKRKYECRVYICLARVWNCGFGGQCSRKQGILMDFVNIIIVLKMV